MNSKEILEQALKLKPIDRLSIINGILESLDKPDSSLDGIWKKITFS